jgi:hypothetical protein
VQVVLNALLTNPAHHELLLKLIRSWPPNLYSHSAIITAIQLQLSTSSKTDALKEVSIGNSAFVDTAIITTVCSVTLSLWFSSVTLLPGNTEY